MAGMTNSFSGTERGRHHTSAISLANDGNSDSQRSTLMSAYRTDDLLTQLRTLPETRTRSIGIAQGLRRSRLLTLSQDIRRALSVTRLELRGEFAEMREAPVERDIGYGHAVRHCA